MNELEVTFEGRRYNFEPAQSVAIGRSSDSDVVVGDPTVSRQHARLTWGPGGWVMENLGRSGTFVLGQPVPRMLITDAVQLRLATPEGPLVEVRTRARAAAQASSGGGAPPLGTAPTAAQASTGAPQLGTAPNRAQATAPANAPAAPAAAHPAGAGGAGSAHGGPRAARLARRPGPRSRGGRPPAAAHTTGAPGLGPGDELATAFHILVPVRSWLTDPGWRQGTRLLVIPYALLPLLFLALFRSSGNLSAPGWAYSLYVAPLWAIAFWLLIRPGPVGRLEAVTGAGVVAWVLLWMTVLTINLNNQLNAKSFAGALGIGFNEEAAKALPILLAALLLLRLRNQKLGVRMWMFLGTIAGLTFGVREASLYTTQSIEHIAASAHSPNQAVMGALSFAFRVFVDGIQHAIWAGMSAFFIALAVNYPRRRLQLIAFGVSMPAVLHALNDWMLLATSSLWPWILIQALSLVLFLGYTMSATSIERNVRRTPLFRGDSILMERLSEPGGTGGTGG